MLTALIFFTLNIPSGQVVHDYHGTHILHQDQQKGVDPGLHLPAQPCMITGAREKSLAFLFLLSILSTTLFLSYVSQILNFTNYVISINIDPFFQD